MIKKILKQINRIIKTNESSKVSELKYSAQNGVDIINTISNEKVAKRAQSVGLLFFFGFGLLGFAIGCDSKKDLTARNHYESSPLVRAKDNIHESILIAKKSKKIKGQWPQNEKLDGLNTKQSLTIQGNLDQKDDLNTSGYKIEIYRSALDKEFLLQSSMILQPVAAMSSGLKSRIVRFVERENEIILLDSVDGNSVTKDIPQRLILAIFPIISKSPVDNDEIIKFDFNKGMSELFITEDWRASDFNGIEYNPIIEYRSTPVHQSYIEEAIYENNHIVLKQVARIEITSFSDGSKSMLPTEIKYYLSPYRPSATFKPNSMKQDFDRMGFFEAAPYQEQNSGAQINLSKFDDTKPIVFAISENTPELFKEAVKDGIVYWNKAFGKEVIKVVDAPKGVHAPDLNYNVVQWINWDEAGYAYADAQMDPRTGENLHAQIYFTSAFAVHGKIQARQLLKRISDLTKFKNQKVRIGLKGFISNTVCDFSLTNFFLTSLSNLLDSDVDDSKILKAAQDYVREVSAHEVGHTLGLRHNFAGSLSANYSIKERPQIIKNYFENGKTDNNIITSSSVMEYQVFEEGAMTGDLVAKAEQALPYDEKAIKTLYLNQSFKAEEIPLYCTDSHVIQGLFADCERFDIGPSVVDAKKWDADQDGKSLTQRILNYYIFAKAPLRGVSPMPVEKVQLPNAKELAMLLLTRQFGFLKLVGGNVNLLKIQRQFPVVDGENRDTVEKSEREYLTSELNARGGIKKITLDIDSDITNSWSNTFEILIDKNKSGVGFNEQNYQFTEPEIVFIKTKVNHFFKQLGIELQRVNLTILSGAQAYSEWGINDSFSFKNSADLPEIPSLLSSIARKYLFAVTENKQFVDIEVDSGSKNADGTNLKKKILIGLPEFKNTLNIRQTALGLLKHKTAENPFWMVLEKRKTVKSFDEFMNKIFTVPLSTILAEEMPSPSASQWVLENQFLGIQLQLD